MRGGRARRLSGAAKGAKAAGKQTNDRVILTTQGSFSLGKGSALPALRKRLPMSITATSIEAVLEIATRDLRYS